jgi:hypothetical protein
VTAARDRYDVSNLVEAPFEPGSGGRVLKNPLYSGGHIRHSQNLAGSGGLKRNYDPMERIFAAVVKRTMRLAEQ